MLNKFKYFWIRAIWFLPLLINPFGSNPFSLFRVFFLSVWLFIGACIWVYEVYFKEKNVIYPKNFFIYFVGLFFVLILNYWFSVTPGNTLWGSSDRVQGIWTIAMYFGLFWVLLQNKDILDKSFMKFGLCVFGLISTHAVLQKFGFFRFSDVMYNTYSQRVYGLVGHPNFLGQLLAPMVVIGVYLFRDEKRYKWFYAFLTVIIVLALFFTENRASWLALFGGLSLILFMKWDLSLKKKLLILFLGGVFLFGLVYMYAPSLRSLSTRLILWRTSLPLVLDSFWIGHGLESFKSVYQSVASADLMEYEPIYSVASRSHNYFLDLLIEAGVLGVFMFSIYFYSGVKFIKEKSYICVAWLVAFMALFFSFPLVEHWTFIILLYVYLIKDSDSLKKIKVSVSWGRNYFVGMFFVFTMFSFVNASAYVRADILYNFGSYLVSETENIDLGYDLIIESYNSYPSNYSYTVKTLNLILFLNEYGEVGEYDNFARILFDRMEEIRGMDFFYYFMKGQYYTSLGNYELAESYYIDSLELAPSNPKVMRELSIMYFYSEDCENGITYFEEYLDVIPNTWELSSKDILNDMEKRNLRIFLKNAEGDRFWDIFRFADVCYQRDGDESSSNKIKLYLKDPTGL